MLHLFYKRKPIPQGSRPGMGLNNQICYRFLQLSLDFTIVSYLYMPLSQPFLFRQMYNFFPSAHTIPMRRKFLICGLTGWCMEILFTAFDSFRRRELKLMGRTSVWMFPIYGMAVLIEPAYHLTKKFPALLRGFFYSAGIFIIEFLSGSFLKKHSICPWDYSRAKANINGVIRLDYTPFWMAAGLIFEKILTGRKKA